jgi:ubiquinone/menaquinone biosynthesis C-methylase UbiE
MHISSHYDENAAKNFLKLRHIPNLTFLIYRDIPRLIEKYISSGRALDFGCGPGVSTRFFARLGFEVIGIDINKDMLKEALSEPDGIPFALINHGTLPFADDSFKLVSSIMVLLEMPDLRTIKEAVNEIYRVLQPGGVFLAVVGSEHFHRHEWLNKTLVDPIKYQNINVGDEFYTYSKITGITFKDYFYASENYIDIFSESGFSLLKIHRALGREEDGIAWTLEKQLNPFTHFICLKN